MSGKNPSYLDEMDCRVREFFRYLYKIIPMALCRGAPADRYPFMTFYDVSGQRVCISGEQFGEPYARGISITIISF